MPRRKGHGLVGTTGDSNELLNAVGWVADTLDDAAENGALNCTKIRGRWVYAASTSVDVALAEVEEAAVNQLRAWLIGAAPWLRNPVASACSKPRVTAGAAELLLRELVHELRIGCFGMLDTNYEPYLALYALDDGDEIEAQLAAMAERLTQHGRVESSDLPAPRRNRVGNGWTSLVLRHGEFLGLGTLQEGVLVSWEALGAE
jgi:hypothetical protein